MGIFRDIVTAVRGGASEVGEAIVDSQALRILEQEIRDADEAISKAKQSLSKLKAQEIGLAKESSVVNSDIDDYTSKAKKALEKQDRDLALKIAERISDLQSRKADLDEQQAHLSEQVDKIYHVIQQREKQIKNNKMELQKAKTYEDLQKTQRAVASAMPTNDNSAKRVHRAMNRVKQKQSETENKMDADKWLADLENGSDLDKSIADAGLDDSKSSANDILAKLEAGN